MPLFMVLIDVSVVNVAQSYNCWEAFAFSAMDSYTNNIQICARCTSLVAITCTIYPRATRIANITMGFPCQFCRGDALALLGPIVLHVRAFNAIPHCHGLHQGTRLFTKQLDVADSGGCGSAGPPPPSPPKGPLAKS